MEQETINTFISITALILTGVGVVGAILIPMTLGLIKINKSIESAITRLTHVESTTDAAAPKLEKIGELESRIIALERNRQETEPDRIRMFEMMSEIKAKTESTSRSIGKIWERINDKQ